MTNNELKLIAEKSRIWPGPNVWGWDGGYRLSIQEAISNPEFG